MFAKYAFLACVCVCVRQNHCDSSVNSSESVTVPVRSGKSEKPQIM